MSETIKFEDHRAKATQIKEGEVTDLGNNFSVDNEEDVAKLLAAINAGGAKVSKSNEQLQKEMQAAAEADRKNRIEHAGESERNNYRVLAKLLKDYTEDDFAEKSFGDYDEDNLIALNASNSAFILSIAQYFIAQEFGNGGVITDKIRTFIDSLSEYCSAHSVVRYGKLALELIGLVTDEAEADNGIFNMKDHKDEYGDSLRTLIGLLVYGWLFTDDIIMELHSKMEELQKQDILNK